MDRSVDRDSATVAALSELLRGAPAWRRPASHVGRLYEGERCVHRQAFRNCGGVSGFVQAHSDTFVLEPARPGGTCPSIRLLSDVERSTRAKALAARAEAQQQALAARAEAQQQTPSCRFFQQGRCNRGDACRFAHNAPTLSSPQAAALPSADAPAPADAPAEAAGHDGGVGDGGTGAAVGAVDAEAVQKQVKYYFSDENLQHDPFFQRIIAASRDGWVDAASLLKCRRLQALGVTSAEALLATLSEAPPPDDLEYRTTAGFEAVRRVRPQPVLQDRTNSGSPAEVLEASLEEWPLDLLCNLGGPGWRPILEDHARRSFCYIRRNSWPAERMEAEFRLLYMNAAWSVLRSKRENAVTRSTAWYTAPGCCCDYAYADVVIQPQERPPWLAAIETRVLGEACGIATPNWPTSVNLNLYEDDTQNVGWHSDDEGLFRGNARDCRIISASWGCPRRFDVALKDRRTEFGKPGIVQDTLQHVTLFSGDILSMEGLFQKHYSHQLAKGPAGTIPAEKLMRINITWRTIVQHKYYCPYYVDP